jgi:hypothetical protein
MEFHDFLANAGFDVWIDKRQLKGGQNWDFEIKKDLRDSWDGLPGYETDLQVIRLNSEENPQVSEISDVIKGWLVAQGMEQRRVRFEQNPEFYNFGESRSFRQNSFEASCGEPKIKERVISISYSAWWYNAKAAHPNHFFRTFNFMLDPVVEIKSLEDVFKDSAAALGVVSEEAGRQLLRQSFEGMTLNDEPLSLPEEWVRSGTQAWDDLASFAFGEEGIELLFAPYQVAAYAFGPQFVTIPYTQVVKLMKKEFAHALGVEHLTRDYPRWPFGAEAEKGRTVVSECSEGPFTGAGQESS